MIELTPATFETFIRHPLVLVKMYTSWCGPCKSIAPHLAAMALQYGQQMRFGKLDTDKAPGIMRRYGIRGVPTLMVFRNGEDAESLVGAHTKAQMEAFVRKALGAGAAPKENAEERSALDAAIPRRGFRRGP